MNHDEAWTCPYSKSFWLILNQINHTNNMHQLNRDFLSPMNQLPQQDKLQITNDFERAKTIEYFQIPFRLLLLEIGIAYLSVIELTDEEICNWFSKILENLKQMNLENSKLAALVYNNRALRLSDMNKNVEAIRDYSRALEIEPRYTLVLYNRGIAYSNENVNDKDRAIADYSLAIKYDPTYPYPYNNRGVAYYDDDKLDLAVDDFTKAIYLNNSYASAFFNRSLVWGKKKMLIKSLSDLNSSIRCRKVHERLSTYVNKSRMLTNTIKKRCRDDLFEI
jgi:tetratricopeptide (TPR) repeat protein